MMKSVADKRAMIDRKHPQLSISGQCELIDLHRSVFYYQSAQESQDNLDGRNRLSILKTSILWHSQNASSITRDGL